MVEYLRGIAPLTSIFGMFACIAHEWYLALIFWIVTAMMYAAACNMLYKELQRLREERT